MEVPQRTVKSKCPLVSQTKLARNAALFTRLEMATTCMGHDVNHSASKQNLMSLILSLSRISPSHTLVIILRSRPLVQVSELGGRNCLESKPFKTIPWQTLMVTWWVTSLVASNNVTRCPKHLAKHCQMLRKTKQSRFTTVFRPIANIRLTNGLLHIFVGPQGGTLGTEPRIHNRSQDGQPSLNDIERKHSK